MRKSKYTLRLRFQYKLQNIDLVKKELIQMLPPPFISLKNAEKLSGSWIEIQNSKGKILHIQRIPQPIRYYQEVLSDKKDKSFELVKKEEPEGFFHLFIPLFNKDVNLVIFSSIFDPHKGFLPAKILGKFNLKMKSIMKGVEIDE